MQLYTLCIVTSVTFCFSLLLTNVCHAGTNSSLYLNYSPCENVSSQKFNYDSNTLLLQYQQYCAVSTSNSDPVTLETCDEQNSAQQWTFTSDGQFKSTKNSCLDVYDQTGPSVDEWTCKSPSDPTVYNQEWIINGNQIKSKLNKGYCLTALTSGCPYNGWNTHQLRVDFTSSTSLINASTNGVYINQSKYGMEGGQIVLVNNTFYLFITEFTGDPLYVPSNLTLWSITISAFKNGEQWNKLSTLYQSGGTCDCNSTRASLGSSISVAYNETNTRWYVFYVGFQSCNNDSYFVNRNGRIWISESQTIGINGITGPYKDIDIIIKYPDTNQQPWEGLQGVDSFSNPYKMNSTHYAAFYGSAQTGKTPCCNQEVGLAFSTSYYGPWIRAPYPQINPVKLMYSPLEQPIVIQYKDGTFGAVFDALSQQNKGQVGYSWSPDGINWNSNCMQLLTVNPPNGLHWGDARTPEGLIPIDGEDGKFYLFFTGWDDKEASNYESFGYVTVSFTSS